MAKPREQDHGPNAEVEWSDYMEATRNQAGLTGPQPQYSWARFEFEWEAKPGDRVIVTRATSEAGNTQPDIVQFNEKGYPFNQPLPHPIRVT